MTSHETAFLEKVLVKVITRRAGRRPDARAVAAAARSTYAELAAVFVPLISQPGTEALLARALHMTKRLYPHDHAGDEQAAEPFDHVCLWLERQDATIAIDAAVAVFSTFAALLATPIGEPLTTRYLQKAWPEELSRTRSEGTEK